eukprot:scaffold39838_cov70-Phaeocystis_antarctica.AAC.4
MVRGVLAFPVALPALLFDPNPMDDLRPPRKPPPETPRSASSSISLEWVRPRPGLASPLPATLQPGEAPPLLVPRLTLALATACSVSLKCWSSFRTSLRPRLRRSMSCCMAAANAAAHLLRAADAVLGVELALLLRAAAVDERLVDAVRRHRTQQLQQEDAGAHRVVAAPLDAQSRADRADALVGPAHDVALGHAHRGEELHHVGAHELPQDGERELGRAVGDVLAADAHHLHALGLRDLERVVAVLDALVHVTRPRVGTLPVDATGPELVHDAQQRQPRGAVLKQVVGLGGHSERGEPALVCARLAVVSLLLGVRLAVDQAGRDRLEPGARAHQVCEETEQQLRLARGDILRGDRVAAAAERRRVGADRLGAAQRRRRA